MRFFMMFYGISTFMFRIMSLENLRLPRQRTFYFHRKSCVDVSHFPNCKNESRLHVGCQTMQQHFHFIDILNKNIKLLE